MNKKLPYEEALGQQLGNLPLPDEDTSWQKMQELLDEKKRRSPFFLYSDNSKSVLILLLVLGFLVVMHASRYNRTANASAETTKHTLQTNSPAFRPAPVARSGSNRAGLKPGASSSRPGSAGVHTYPSLTPAQPAYTPGLNHSDHSGKINESGSKTARAAAPESLVSFRTAGQKWVARNKPGSVAPEHRLAGSGKQVEPRQPDPIHPAAIAESRQNHGVAAEVFPGPPGKETRLPALRAVAEKKTDQKEQDNFLNLPTKPFFISAGVGVQQPIPVGGQKQVSFNLNGQKNLLSDYIPSLFLRFEKDRKWYLQAEFSYANPQLVNDFSYSRQTRTDMALQTVTTSLLLKKVFYREIPLSFNYYLRPNWTVGAGATYSWFHSAITEKETATRNLQNQTSFVAKQIVPIERYTDSFLYRSHSYLLLQTNYQWQSLSLGLRFSKDVQPYIRYTLPDGTVADKRNWSLELLVRLGLWKSSRL